MGIQYPNQQQNQQQNQNQRKKQNTMGTTMICHDEWERKDKKEAESSYGMRKNGEKIK